MKKISLFALVLLLALSSCEKKTAEITVDSRWTGSMEVQDIPLANTLTVYSDKSFTLDTTVRLFGVGMNFNKVGLGRIQGDLTEEGEVTLTLEELAPDIMPILELVGATDIPLPLAITATVQNDILTLPDIGLGQKISLQRQQVQ